MNKNIILTFTLLFFSTIGVTGQTGTDTQIWTQNTLEFKLDKDNEKLRGLILSDIRAIDDVSNLADLRFGFGVKYKATDNIDIQPSYMFRNQRIAGADDRQEHHFMFDVTPNKKFKNISIDNRNRLEHRIITGPGNDDDTFYRNRTRVKIPVRKNGETVVTPFAFSDTWFDIQDLEVERNDAAFGVNQKFSKNVSTDFYYLYRRNFQGGNKHENVIGINFTFKID
jgi:hypothetical protein